MKQDFKVIDYTERYKSIMQFNKNKNIPVHQWYPFVEGYSKEFIQDIVNELDYYPECVLEPFSGSGTTAVEMQNIGIKCISFEVSPFMYMLSKVKLSQDYKYDLFEKYLENFKKEFVYPLPNIRQIEPIPFGDTVVKNEKLQKWNFNDEVMDGILDIKKVIKEIPNEKYRDLFSIALSSILLEVSNLFRNGKCLSYKKNWFEKVKYRREDIHQVFIKKLEMVFKEDILMLNSKENPKINNSDFCYLGDVRKNLSLVEDCSIDLVITSPPYLNSRDYTDIYMLELKVLDLVKNFDELRLLRKETIRSHVQVKYEELELLNYRSLIKTVSQISEKADAYWNKGLLNMIKGYFLDMDILLSQIKKKMKPGKKAFINVANSAYYGLEVPVDLIICEIAEKYNFKVIEIRKARDLKTSSQQSKLIKSLRESVIVLES
ncbi:hypothetical protein [Pantoea ananatis]|uniref:hypothetical protein n=1 Tax=Pantoea ananas TaxID=553 RepID=UPI001B30DE89|nr:hypothetical protein [Pantoea ananatis]